MSLRDGFRTRLWPLPTSTVVVAIVLGVVIPRLEATRSAVVPHALDGLLFTGGADAARSVLEAVAGSLITVTSLTFSLTVVTLQLASSQFSPRLLRTFTRDLVVQATLGLFLGTFAYALTVLRTVRAVDDSRTEFVPDLSVTLAFVLAIVSVIVLIFFLAHLTQTIRVESMLRSVGEDASATLTRERQLGILGGQVYFGAWTEAWGRAAAHIVHEQHPEVDAIFCGSDQIARGVLDALRDAGRRVPQDVAVIGFDNWEVVATNARPELTSVDMNLQQIGSLPAQRVFEAIDGIDPQPGEHALPCRIVTRASTFDT